MFSYTGKLIVSNPIFCPLVTIRDFQKNLTTQNPPSSSINYSFKLCVITIPSKTFLELSERRLYLPSDFSLLTEAQLRIANTFILNITSKCIAFFFSYSIVCITFFNRGILTRISLFFCCLSVCIA